MSSTLSKDQVVEILVKETKHSKEEIEQMIRDTIEEMDNMINEEGAAYVIANKFGVSINASQSTSVITVDQLIPGASNVTILGRVNKIFPTRTFTRKDGTSGKVRNIEIIDKTGTARVALWDSRADAIEEKEISVGQVARISGASVRESSYTQQKELSIGSQGLIEPVSGVDESEFPEVERAPEIKLNQLVSQDNDTHVTIRGKVVDRQGIVTFERKDGGSGKVTSLTLEDTTGKSRVTFWDANTEKALQYDIGDTIKVSDLRVGESQYGKELTYNPYSAIERIDDANLKQIEVNTGGKLETLSELKDGMNNLTVVGKIISFGEVRSFERDGETNYVGNMTLQDQSQSVRVTLWGSATSIIENFSVGTVVRISNCYSKLNDFSNEVELNVSESSTVQDISDSVDSDSFDAETQFVTFNDITSTRRGVSIKVQIVRKFDINPVTLSDGREAKVQNVEVLDINGVKGRIAVWDENIAKLDDIEDQQAVILKNVIIKPRDEYDPQISINQYTTVEETELDDIIPIIQTAANYQNNPLNYQSQNLSNLTEGTQVEIKGTIVKAFKPVIYDACSQCARKLEMEEGVDDVGICPTHQEVQARPRMILTVAIDDTTATANAKIFGDTAEEFLGISAAEAREMIMRLSDERAPVTQKNIEMQEVVIKGKVVRDTYQDRNELQINVDKIELLSYDNETDDILSKFDPDF